jgi:type II secretory pathway pseudopilin PulG
MYKKSFTLIELVLVIAIASLILPLIFFVYLKIQKDKRELDGQQKLIQQTYNFVERLNVLLQDYTIDYEEYFNRQMVGCSAGGGSGKNFNWVTNGSGYCNNFTAYGNGNNLARNSPS